MAHRAATLFFVCILAAACGTPGAPQPPSLELPKPVTDLTATRKGDAITLKWTQPSRTTDNSTIKHTVNTQVCRGGSSCTAASASGSFTESIADAAKSASGAMVNYSVVVANARGKHAGTSNVVSVPITPAQAAAHDVQLELRADAIVVHWQAETNSARNSRTEWKLLRALQGSAKFTDAGHASGEARTFSLRMELLDWEQHYVIKVVGVNVVTGADGQKLAEFESDDSAPAEIFTHDVFPPAIPTGVVAVANASGTERSVDISWSPNTEGDLAGYNIYRRDAGSQALPVKLNTLAVRAAAFKDANVQAGHSYEYFVSAVDVRSNESATSSPAGEKVPE